MRGALAHEMLKALNFLTFATVEPRADGLYLTDMYPPEIREVRDIANARGWIFESLGPATYQLRPEAGEAG